ncbi:MAG: hypothetical protein AB7U75_03640 [Hyphomicrobiaceae bacterium]
MSKLLYLLIFIAAVFAADAIAPIGDEPMWQTAYMSTIALRENLRNLEQTDPKRETTTGRTPGSPGAKPRGGGNG